MTPSKLLLTACSLHNLIRIWNLNNPFDGNYLIGVYHGHSDYIRNFVILPGNRLATSSWDGNIFIWRLPNLVEYKFESFDSKFSDLHYQFI
jgi:WD40 repeat protein